MKLIRPRFSLRFLFIAFTVATLAAYVAALPTFRAERFAELVNADRAEDAEAMLPASIPEYSKLRRTLRLSKHAEIEPLTLREFLGGERRVVVSGPMQFDHPVRRVVDDMLDTGEFIVSWTSVSTGARRFVPTE